MWKIKESCRVRKKAKISALCMTWTLFLLAGATACSAKDTRSSEKISLEQAEEIALSDAGLAESELASIKTDRTSDDGTSLYDIEFYAGNIKYEYEVTADTGSIYSKSKETLDAQANNSEAAAAALPDGNDKTAAGQKQDAAAPTPDTGDHAANGQKQDTADAAGQDKASITLDEAKAAALADAGVLAPDATFTKEKSDYEDGIAVYDIEFFAGNTEYEYEINALTGSVYSKDVEAHHTGAAHRDSSAGSDAYISEDEAVSAALTHAGFTAGDVSLLKSEFDIDDGLAVYDVEFYKGAREYDYKINAADGSVIKYEID